MRLFLFLLLLIAAASSGVCNGYNVLVSVVGVSGSQNLIMVRLAEHLAARGHNVLVLQSRFFKDAKMPKMSAAKLLSYDVLNEDIETQIKDRL